MKILEFFLFLKFTELEIVFECNISWTLSGKKCQKWSQQFPHPHEFFEKTYLGVGDHNYCRAIGSSKR